MPPTTERPRLLRLFVAVGLIALSGCDRDARPTLRVFASASLTAPFTEIARRFTELHEGLRVELHSAGTPQLVMQLRHGAPANVFASADLEHMRRVVAAGYAAGTPKPFARNRLAIVTAPNNDKGITSIEDLSRDDVTCLLCAPNVPAGRYARRAMQRAGLKVTPVSDEPSVRAVASKIEMGVADVGVVYETDALAAKDRLHVISIPERLNVVATYPIVSTSSGGQAANADALISFVLGLEGQRILSEHGFSSP